MGILWFDGTEYDFLSNFYPSPIVWNGKTYATVEHAYQAAKAVSEEDHELVRLRPTPGQAKRAGRSIPLRSDWDKGTPTDVQPRITVMRELLRLKFSHALLRNRLLSTGTQVLVEGNDWHDVFWGKCHCRTHRGRGENWLGVLLMSRRDALRLSVMHSPEPTIEERTHE